MRNLYKGQPLQSTESLISEAPVMGLSCESILNPKVCSARPPPLKTQAWSSPRAYRRLGTACNSRYQRHFSFQYVGGKSLRCQDQRSAISVICVAIMGPMKAMKTMKAAKAKPAPKKKVKQRRSVLSATQAVAMRAWRWA